MQLPPDFKEFLRLLNSTRVEYLLIGGYAVGYYGYPRTTADIDIWISVTPDNVDKIQQVLREFGFEPTEEIRASLSSRDRIVRMGIPPLRIEILTGIDGCDFAECHTRRRSAQMDGVEVALISLEDLKTNKKSSGRFKDLDDLENLP